MEWIASDRRIDFIHHHGLRTTAAAKATTARARHAQRHFPPPCQACHFLGHSRGRTERRACHASLHLLRVSSRRHDDAYEPSYTVIYRVQSKWHTQIGVYFMSWIVVYFGCDNIWRFIDACIGVWGCGERILRHCSIQHIWSHTIYSS